MQRFILVAGIVSAMAVVGSDEIEDLAGRFSQTEKLEAAQPDAENAALVTPGTKVIKGDPRGHFQTEFQINGRNVQGLIDTGATFVAMNERTARRIGISRSELDYRFVVSTANGRALASRVNLKRVEVGAVRVRNVEAYVLEDEALDDTILIGMSFLRKLQSFKVEDGEIALKR